MPDDTDWKTRRDPWSRGIAEQVAKRIIDKGGQLLNVPPADSHITFSSRESLREILSILQDALDVSYEEQYPIGERLRTMRDNVRYALALISSSTNSPENQKGK